MSPTSTELLKALRLAYFFRFLVTFLALIFTILAAVTVLKGSPFQALFDVLIAIAQIVSLEQIQASITQTEQRLNARR